MIQANELRISNWIADHEAGGYFQIEEIYKDSYGTYSASYRNSSIRCTIDTLEKIPLTEEWLVKFGFRKSGHIFWISLFNLKSELHIEIYPKENVITIESDFGILILDPIKHIHTLQNLYFALTGEELTIKK